MERRRKPRRPVAANEPLSNARLRTGGQLRIVDASSWGVLAETAERLLPGRQLDIHVMTAQGRTLVRCRVIRAFVEPALAAAAPETRFQFERHGYFVADLADHAPGRPVYNRAVPLKDPWSRAGGG